MDLLSQLGRVNMDALEKAVVVLKPLKNVTTLMSSQSKTTASIVVVRPLLYKLMKACEPQADDQQPIHQAKASLFHDLENRLVNC